MVNPEQRSDAGDKISRMLWENWDEFFLALRQIAEEEKNRQVISNDLKGWWTQMSLLIDACPALPNDD